MSEDLAFDRSVDAPAGVAVEVAPLVRRIVAPNPSAFTFTGTATYLVGLDDVAVVDPGPDDERHVEAILDAAGGATISRIVVTHTHRDHTGAVAALKERTGATVLGAGPHRAFRDLHLGETNALEAGVDAAYRPDEELSEGDEVTGPGWSLVAIATPGHTANHLAFAMPENALVFSGDHVMAWSTSIVAPPDGAMGPYMASLRKMIARPEELYLPGHGPALRNARTFTRHLLGHRLMREQAIRERLADGPRHISDLVRELYRGLDPRLARAAGLSVFAHIEEMVGRGEVATEGAPALDGLFRKVA